MQSYFTFLKASLTDFVIIIIMTTPCILFFYFEWKSGYKNNIYVFDKETDLIIKEVSVYYIGILYFLFLFKDALNLSVGKRIYNIKIIDNKSKMR